MRAMVLDGRGTPLRASYLSRPAPGPGEVLIDVAACGVCRTDLHIVDGEALAPKVPVRTEVESFPLEQANEALDRLRAGQVRGAAVLLTA